MSGLGIIKTGIVSSLKNDALNAVAEAEAKVSKAMQIMGQVELKPNEVLIEAIGEPVLNFYTANRKLISFVAGKFVADTDDEDVMDAVQHFVKQKRIKESVAEAVPEVAVAKVAENTE